MHANKVNTATKVDLKNKEENSIWLTYFTRKKIQTNFYKIMYD